MDEASETEIHVRVTNQNTLQPVVEVAHVDDSALAALRQAELLQSVVVCGHLLTVTFPSVLQHTHTEVYKTLKMNHHKKISTQS